VTLVFHQYFERTEDAVSAERQIKDWRREKKEAQLRGDYAALAMMARRSTKAENASPPVPPSRRGPAGRSQDEGERLMALTKFPHSEEAAERLSRRTQDADPEF
jgi:hypothetical protein